MCFGVIIEYSTLFDKKYASPDIPLEHRKSKTGLFFLSFSITRNLYKIFNDPSPSGGSSLRILDGLKVLALLWIMLLHGYTIIQYSPIANLSEADKFVSAWGFAFVQSGVFAIDIFLFISAFLGTYLLLVQSNCVYGYHSSEYKGINFGMAYFHRVYRLFPPMVLFIILYMTFFKHLGEGPVWVILASSGVDGCKRDWWSHFLFISNVYPWGEFNRCLPSLWYVSSEIQFFIFLPIQCWVYIRNRYAGFALSVFILLSSMASAFVLTEMYGISISRAGDSNYVNYLYVKPFSRIGAYQVGIIFGMLYFEWKI